MEIHSEYEKNKERGMRIMKKYAGNLLPLIALVMGGLSLGFYLFNCRTNYFAAFGVNRLVAGYLFAGIVLELVFLLVRRKMDKIGDILVMIVPSCFMAALIYFIGARATETAYILTFQSNANNLADLRSALIGIVCCAVAVIFSVVAGFCKNK